MREQYQQLQKALADAQQMVLEQKQLMVVADARYQAMEAHIASLVALPVDSQPLVATAQAASADNSMTDSTTDAEPKEKHARIEHAVTQFGTTTLPRGKGKGKTEVGKGKGDGKHY